METLRVGAPLDKSTDIGAVVSTEQLERITALVEKGRQEGAEVFQPASIQIPGTGTFFAPTLMTGVEPASTVAVVEIFGPVLVAMTFRTPDEAVALANNTRFGLAASIWSENISRSLDVAAKLKAGVVWINATNLFDAAAGFGGYRESGFGREGGREGMLEYLAPMPTSRGVRRRAARTSTHGVSAAPTAIASADASSAMPAIDRTAKLLIGGRQVRPDSGYSYTVTDRSGRPIGQAGLGNRKDIRNAVEAAAKASAWGAASAHQRAQVLYYVAENLAARSAEFEVRVAELCGSTRSAARKEVEAAVQRVFHYAAHADKFDGRVHATRSRHVTLAMNEPWGVLGISCPDEAPLLAFVSLVMPAIAMGNRVVVTPSTRAPLAATDFYQVLDTSDVPAGVVNIVTGERDELARVMADHDDIAACWYWGDGAGRTRVEEASAGNLKFTWCRDGSAIDWLADEARGEAFLRHAVQVKNIWIPYGA